MPVKKIPQAFYHTRMTHQAVWGTTIRMLGKSTIMCQGPQKALQRPFQT